MTDHDRQPIIDLHSHVLPGVDDGAQDLEEAVNALRTLRDEGVVKVMATPHFRASHLERPEREADKLRRFDAAFEMLSQAITARGLKIELGRGCEFKLDAPTADVSDPRLRLNGTRYALVEFSGFQLPPYAGNQLRAVREAGWVPLLAHPERYAGVTGAWDRVEGWVREGTLFQVNARSLLGWYGEEPQAAGRELLRLGWVCCLASDYHARGAPDFDTAVDLLRTGTVVDRVPVPAAESASPLVTLDEPEKKHMRAPLIHSLVYENPRRILADEPTELLSGLEVPHFDRKKRRLTWLR